MSAADEKHQPLRETDLQQTFQPLPSIARFIGYPTISNTKHMHGFSCYNFFLLLHVFHSRIFSSDHIAFYDHIVNGYLLLRKPEINSCAVFLNPSIPGACPSHAP